MPETQSRSAKRLVDRAMRCDRRACLDLGLGRSVMTAKPQIAASKHAGILCNDEQFRRFAAIRSGLPDVTFGDTAAAEYLRTVCRVRSRRDLDTDATGRTRFERLLTDFDAWVGRIARPR